MTPSHWDHIYAQKGTGVTWFQPTLARSLRLIDDRGLGAGTTAIDVGAGNSTLVDDLLDRGLSDITLVDLSPVALETVRKRLGERAEHVTFLAGDITSLDLPAGAFDLWHDRAAFHFLVEPELRAAYVDRLRRSTHPGSTIILVTFGPDGPQRCSGLPTIRYDPPSLHAVVGESDFDLVSHELEVHHTPSESEQQFLYTVFERR